MRYAKIGSEVTMAATRLQSHLTRRADIAAVINQNQCHSLEPLLPEASYEGTGVTVGKRSTTSSWRWGCTHGKQNFFYDNVFFLSNYADLYGDALPMRPALVSAILANADMPCACGYRPRKLASRLSPQDVVDAKWAELTGRCGQIDWQPAPDRQMYQIDLRADEADSQKFLRCCRPNRCNGTLVKLKDVSQAERAENYSSFPAI